MILTQWLTGNKVDLLDETDLPAGLGPGKQTRLGKNY